MKRLRDDQARMHLVMMLALTFSTGIVDAVGYLGLDRVFTANMTGNVVILGMGLAGADDLPVVGPSVALLAFMLGAAAGGRVGRRARTGWSGLTTATFATTGSLAVLLGVGSLVVVPRRDTPWGLVVTALLAVAMGLQAAAARRLAVADVTTVVVTSTIVGLSSDSYLAGGTSKNWPRRLLAVLLILVGATVGALLLRVHVGLGMIVAGTITLSVALLGHRYRTRRSEPEPEPAVA